MWSKTKIALSPARENLKLLRDIRWVMFLVMGFSAITAGSTCGKPGVTVTVKECVEQYEAEADRTVVGGIRI